MQSLWILNQRIIKPECSRPCSCLRAARCCIRPPAELVGSERTVLFSDRTHLVTALMGKTIAPKVGEHLRPNLHALPIE
jgi:hypothetical protein